MQIISVLNDRRIKSKNILVEFTITEYLEIARDMLKNNPFQRKRVKSSSTVYSLLRDDLKAGCVMPPLVLALTGFDYDFPAKFEDIGQNNSFLFFLQRNISEIIILDGLQRTYNILDAAFEISQGLSEYGEDRFYSNKIRCEIYVGIDKIGILYRMLTLNTGQTPMSLRHQIEILYSNYLDTPLNGIKFLREIDDARPEKLGEYSFKEIIEGFTSYLMRDYLTFDKVDILSNIKSLEKLSIENQNLDIFTAFTKCYHKFQVKIQDLCNDWHFDMSNASPILSKSIYGKDVNSIFNKSQSMTGIGSAIGFLKDRLLISGFWEIEEDIDRIRFSIDVNLALNKLLVILDDIRKNAPKIGNAQRLYFHYFFRELFNRNGDSYLIIDEAIENASRRYQQNA